MAVPPIGNPNLQLPAFTLAQRHHLNAISHKLAVKQPGLELRYKFPTSCFAHNLEALRPIAIKFIVLYSLRVNNVNEIPGCGDHASSV